MLREIMFEGQKAVELTTGSFRLAAVYGVGPRVAFFGKPGGENLLFWDAAGKYARGQWYLRGGHRVWVARPGADESEETYFLDNAPCEMTRLDDGFLLTAPIDPINKTQRSLEVRTLDERHVRVRSVLRNAGDMLYSASVWALTCSLPKPGTKYYFPVGDGSDWDCFTMVMFRSWGGHRGKGFNDPQITFTDDMIVLDPQGLENKRMFQSRSGVQAMVDPARDVTFAKKTAYNPQGRYPLGTNAAFYVGPGNFMVEMETMGEEVTLRPGESALNEETWVLRDGAVAPKNIADCQRLFS